MTILIYELLVNYSIEFNHMFAFNHMFEFNHNSSFTYRKVEFFSVNKYHWIEAGKFI